MTTAIQQCDNQEPEDPCERLRNLIRKLVFQIKQDCGERGLRERIMDQIYGKNGPGTPEWTGHDIAITQIKNRIDKLMKTSATTAAAVPPSSERQRQRQQ